MNRKTGFKQTELNVKAMADEDIFNSLTLK
jgi:hypothetical protein